MLAIILRLSSRPLLVSRLVGRLVARSPCLADRMAWHVRLVVLARLVSGCSSRAVGRGVHSRLAVASRLVVSWSVEALASRFISAGSGWAEVLVSSVSWRDACLS